MRRTTVLLLLVVGLSARGDAQAAHIGRLRLLSLPAHGATCAATTASPALQHSGIVRVFNIDEPGHPRLLSLGLTAAREPRMLLIMRSTPVGDRQRKEGESITVFFDGAGAVTRGNRSAYTTGTPARRNEDQHASLFAADSALAQTMARALVRLCSA